MEIKILMKIDVCSALQNVNAVIEDNFKKLIKVEKSDEFTVLNEKIKKLVNHKEYLISKLDELKNYDMYYFLDEKPWNQ